MQVFLHGSLASRRELPHHLLYVSLGQRPHVGRGEITNWMGQDHKGMLRHPFGPELKLRRPGESLRNDDRRRNATLFESNRVVHTAQRAGASATDGGDSHLDLLRHRLNDDCSGGF